VASRSDLASPALRGFSRTTLAALIERFGEGSIPANARYDALARFEELPARETLKAGRYWKHDLTKLDFSAIAPFDGDASVELDLEPLQPAARRHGVVIEHLSRARERHPELFERAFGRALDTRDDKFASLALAFQHQGVFVAIPDGVVLDEPIVIGYEAREAASFPYTIVFAGEGSQATVIERLAGARSAPLLCGLTELVVGDRARLTYAVAQNLPSGSRSIVTRRATLGADATLEFALAELGGSHAVSRLRSSERGAGSSTLVSVAFFANEAQHVDVETETEHAATSTTSDTIVRSAGTDRGQGRFLGNIKILAHAHGANASLRDDALLLSKDSHVDSVPALEIAANDVKAYHGATVGAISEDEIFYAASRGIPRNEAERMIALGFFEPAVARFPHAPLRDEIRTALEHKLPSPENA
jgi:Fe-S cluster assembly protein SufD